MLFQEHEWIPTLVGEYLTLNELTRFSMTCIDMWHNEYLYQLYCEKKTFGPGGWISSVISRYYDSQVAELDLIMAVDEEELLDDDLEYEVTREAIDAYDAMTQAIQLVTGKNGKVCFPSRLFRLHDTIEKGVISAKDVISRLRNMVEED